MIRVIACVLALLVCAPAVVHAQPGPAQQQNRREKIKKRIRAMRAYMLSDELQLDEATAAKLFPLLARYDDEFDKLLVQRGDLVKRLQAARDGKDGRAIDKLIDDALANQRSLWDLEEKRITDVRKILTPQQAARLVIVLPQLERQIQNQLRRAVQGGGGPNAKKLPPDLDDGGDDDGPPPPKRPGRNR